MEGLVNLGHEIVICPLRPPVKHQGVSGLMVPEARVGRANLTPGICLPPRSGSLDIGQLVSAGVGGMWLGISGCT
jgi:hypothetical protein